MHLLGIKPHDISREANGRAGNAKQEALKLIKCRRLTK